MLPGTKTCLICHTPLSFHPTRTGNLCGNPQCQAKYSSSSRRQTCVVCGRPLSPWEFAAKVCADPQCQRSQFGERLREQCERDRQKTVAQREEARILRAALLEQARKLRDREAAAAGIREPASYPLAVIPSFAARVTNLSERRRRDLRDHLTRLIGQATVGRRAPPRGATGPESAPEPALASAAQAVLGQACARCRGHCCSGGGDRAYLTAAIIQRVLDTRPDLRPRDVLAAYLACVGPKTYEGSCIYHRPDGCGLPRELRSYTCNQHFCDGLTDFQDRLPDAGPVRGFFASTSDGTIHSAAFIDDTEVRVVPVSAIRDESQPKPS